MKLLHSTTIRLTLWYLGIIMLISMLFSIVLYGVSTKEFNREILIETKHAPTLFVPKGYSEFRRLRLQLAKESKHNVKFNLIIFNLVILGAGGLLSYFLAKRTLQPIEDAIQSQNRFIADASHELRTPLTTIKTEIEVALRDDNLKLMESKLLHKSTLEEVERLESLTNSLLRIAHTEDKFTHSKRLQNCHMEKIILKTIKQITPLAQKKQIQIKSKIEPSLIKAECASIEELLTILLDNAIKYSPEESTIEINCRTNTRSKELIIKIKDQGIGIKSSDLPHIFDRFYRADLSRSKQNTHGYGLGLSIAKKITEAHGGRIEVFSKIGSGTTFTIYIPLTK